MRAPRVVLLLSLITVAAFQPLHAQSSGALSGRVVDKSGAPLIGATISIDNLSRAVASSSSGDFTFGALPAARYLLTARKTGYLPKVQNVLMGSSPMSVTITLAPGTMRLEPVNVTASRDVANALTAAMPTSVLTADQLHQDGGVSLAHALARLPGVRSVSSGEQIGKPMIRGLFGPRTLVLADGHRIEDYSWSDEDGPSIDPRLAQRVEVVRGPASVLYGSDALSGAVNVIPEPLPISKGTDYYHLAGEAYGGSNNIELGTALKAEGVKGRFGYRVLGTGRFAMNYQTPAGEQQNSGFFAVNGDAALGWQGDRSRTTVRFSHYGGEFHLLEASGPEVGDSTGGPVRQTLDDRLQFDRDMQVGSVRLETRAQYQRHGLAEVSDDCVPPQGQTTCEKVKDKQAFGLTLNTITADVLAHHVLGEHVTGTVGVSGGYQSSSSDGPIFLVPGANIRSLAGYALERADLGVVEISAGLRADSRDIASDALSALSLASDSRDWTATTGTLGAVVHPTAHFAVLANVGSGWRAPTIFDLYANGPNLAEYRYEIGDKTLKTERALNVETGVRWISDAWHVELNVFSNTINDFIYTTPTTQVLQALPVFKHVQADARLQGGEALVEWQATDRVALRASHDRVEGTDRRNNSPLPLMAPNRTQLGTELRNLHAGSLGMMRLGADVELVDAQHRLSAVDYATNSYSLVNASIGIERPVHSRAVRFDVVVHNLFNAKYKDFLSRYKTFAYAPGANVIFKVSTAEW
jgi:outer membrane receptor protein involved in Fe transport